MHPLKQFLDATYNNLYRFGASLVWHPNMLLLMSASIIVIWIWVAASVGRKAETKGQSFWYGFLLSTLAGPVVGTVFVAALRPSKKAGRSLGSRKRLSVTRERVA